jgi:hypothetical protein
MAAGEARLCSGPPPSAPPPELVARAVLDLKLPHDHPVLLHLRASAADVWREVEQLQARALYYQLRQDDFTVGEALLDVAKRFGVSGRTIRRWVLDRD